MDRSHNFCDFFRSYYFSISKFRVIFFFSFNIFERITDIFGLVDENVGHIGGEHGAWRVMYINWELILKTERFVFIREINSLFGFWKVDSWKIYLLLLSCNSFLSSYRYIYRKVSFYFYFYISIRRKIRNEINLNGARDILIFPGYFAFTP